MKKINLITYRCRYKTNRIDYSMVYRFKEFAFTFNVDKKNCSYNLEIGNCQFLLYFINKYFVSSIVSSLIPQECQFLVYVYLMVSSSQSIVQFGITLHHNTHSRWASIVITFHYSVSRAPNPT